MDYLEVLGWIACISSIIGLYFNANDKIICWPIWIVGSLIWVLYFSFMGNVQSIILWSIYIVFNIYGWHKWKLKTRG
jgi:nicotinamide riboside transporter PnuC